MRKWIFLCGLFISSELWAAMGYLGRYPYTKTVAQLKADFNVAPPAPAPSRRAQYAYMAVPLYAVVSENVSTEQDLDTPPDAEKIKGLETDSKSDPQIFQEPEKKPTGDPVDWDSL